MVLVNNNLVSQTFSVCYITYIWIEIKSLEVFCAVLCGFSSCYEGDELCPWISSGRYKNFLQWWGMLGLREDGGIGFVVLDTKIWVLYLKFKHGFWVHMVVLGSGILCTPQYQWKKKKKCRRVIVVGSGMIGRGTSLWLKSFDTIFIGGKKWRYQNTNFFFFFFFFS